MTLQNVTDGAVGCPATAHVAKSRTKQPLLRGFGELLKELRVDAETHVGNVLSHDALARMVMARANRWVETGGPTLSFVGSTLWRWEEGQVSSPDPLALRELADIYQVDFYGLLAVLIANRQRPDLTPEDARRILQEASGRVSEAATTRILGLEKEVLLLLRKIRDRDQFIAELQDAAIKMYRLFQSPEEDRAAPANEQRRRGPGRKAG